MKKALVPPGWARLLFSFALCIYVGCAPEPTEPSTLESVQIPADFDFATTRPVTIEVGTTGASGIIEVRTPGDALVFRGPLIADRVAKIQASVPTAAETLRLDLVSPDANRSVVVPVSGSTLRHTF